MLASEIVRIGRPIKNSNMSSQDRICLLTDVNSENCKNYFRHVFLLERSEMGFKLQFMELGNMVSSIENGKTKESYQVDQNKNVAFPIFYPNGGNPLHAQGLYPLPCYLLYDPHIKAFEDQEAFKKEFLLPRLGKTLGYRELSQGEREMMAEQIAALMATEGQERITQDKQLGILMIFDERLSVFRRSESDGDNPVSDAEPDLIYINDSRSRPGFRLYLDGPKVLKNIGLAKFLEAAELGKEEHAVSTFTNREADQVVSIYNKSWLWLSPTWEMPRSIYWSEEEWTKGIKVDEESYTAYLYGVQFLKGLQVPVSSAILKEMFAPVTSVEAKKNMSYSSFEAIYGIPMVLPLADGDSQQLFSNYRRMLKKSGKQSDSDLQLKVLAGIDTVLPEFGDEHRLTVLYYSGDLSRGNMHIRAVIEDVIPSVAGRIQDILGNLRRKELGRIQEAFGLKEQNVYKTETLPALLANAYGPGYLWPALQAALHKEPLRLERLQTASARRLNELANREDTWQMAQELVFYYSFLYFFNQYEKNILQKQGGVRTLADWKEFMQLYAQGKLEVADLEEVEKLGFAAGLLLKQFSNSYYQKRKNSNPKADFVKDRVMKFGSKLTPEMVWKGGLLRCEELSKQWDMNLGGNFHPNLAQTLLGFLAQQNQLIPEGDKFMTAFWSGYLLYKSEKKNDQAEEEKEDE